MAGLTQTERLRRYLADHPGASSLEITRDLSICNVTGRVSDLRADGHPVIASRDDRGVYRYRLIDERPLVLFPD